MNNDQAQKQAESYSVSKYGSYNDTAINGFIAGYIEQQLTIEKLKSALQSYANCNPSPVAAIEALKELDK